MTETADIVVIGGGCIGASIALYLAQQQAGRVLLLEQKELANGASGKGIGIIRTHYTHPTLAKLAQQSLKRFHQFQALYGGHDPGFHACGYFILVGEADVKTLNAIAQQHRSFGINIQSIQPQQLKAEIPALQIEDIAAVAYEPDSGYGSPPQTTLAFAQRAAELGVEIRTQTPVIGIKQDTEGRIQAVVTPQGAIATRTVVDCVGPWARQLTESIGLPFPVTPIVEHVVVVERPAAVRSFHPVISDLVNLCYMRSDTEQSFTRIGNSDPTYHPQFSLSSADQFHGQMFPNICETLHQKLIRRFPALAQGAIAQTYSGIWGVTPDYQPIIDHLGHGLYCAVGFSGHGYKLSPIIGELVSQMIMGKTNEMLDWLQIFRYARFQEDDWIKAPLSYSKAKGLR